MCLLNSMPQHRWLPLGHWPSLQLGSGVLQLLMMPLRKEMAGKHFLLTDDMVLCLFLMSEVLRTPTSTAFQFSQLCRPIYCMKGECNKNWKDWTTCGSGCLTRFLSKSFEGNWTAQVISTMTDYRFVCNPKEVPSIPMYSNNSRA